MAEKKKFKFAINGKNIVVLILLAAIVVSFYLSTSRTSSGTESVQDEYALLMAKDLETSYPETPKEVVKLYSRFVKCLYKGKLSDSKTKDLVEQMRLLFDERLLEQNSLEDQIKKLNSEVKVFKFEKKTIFNYEVNEDTLETGAVDGVESATIVAGFSIHKQKEYTRTNELFLLRKNADGQWKIVGWQLVDEEMDSEETQESI